MQESLSTLTQELIRIPSVSNDIEKLHVIVNFIQSEFSGIQNAIIEVVEQNSKPSLIIKNFDGLWGDICLNGHLDVVPSSEDGQFDPIVKDGKIYGRGSIDMKGPVSALIIAMKDILASKADKKVLMLLTCDEEIGGENGAGYCTGLGYGADVVLIPDAAGLHKIITAGKGIYTMHISVPGKGGHSAYPWKSKNAIEQAMNLYRDLKEQIEEEVELMEENHRGTSVQMTGIKAGEAYNAIPGEAHITINIRHTESYTETLLKNLCKNILSKYEATVISDSYGGLVFTSEDDPVFQTYKSISDSVTGGDLEFKKLHGATDAKRFSESGAIAILHGANGENLHGKDEYVEIASLETLYKITKKFVLES